MVKLGLAMVVGVAPALVSWWRGGPAPALLSPCSPTDSDKLPRWPHRSPSLSDCLESSSDEESARSIVCHVRPKLVSDQSTVNSLVLDQFGENARCNYQLLLFY